MKKWISMCLAVVITAGAVSGGIALEPAKAKEAVPEGVDITLDGAFIQPGLYMSYSPDQWDTELELLKSLGVDSLIMGDAMNYNEDIWEVQYNSQVTEIGKMDKRWDTVEPLLENCKKHGIKVYLGFGNNQDWKDKHLVSAKDAEWFQEQIGYFIKIAEDLYNVYHERYPETMAGWYFVPELANDPVWDTTDQRSVFSNNLSKGFNRLIEKFEELDPEMPLYFSPYSSRIGFASSKGIEAFYTEFFEKTNFRKIDAMIPMDNIGGGGMKLQYLEEYTKAYYEACKANDFAPQFWSNNESFIQWDTDPLGIDASRTWGTATLDRFIKQLEITGKYATKHFNFAYSHYYSPVFTVAGYHETYLEYMKTGKLDSEPPSAPTKVRTEMTAAGLQLSWSGMYDNKGIARINIYKNGKFWDYLSASGEIQYGAMKRIPPFADTDAKVKSINADQSIVYEIEAVDCAGNASPTRAKVVVTADNYNNGVILDSPYFDNWDQDDPMGLNRPVRVYDVDQNGKISSIDAFIVLEYVAGMRELEEAQRTAADTNGDLRIRSSDALRILEIVAGVGTGISA